MKFSPESIQQGRLNQEASDETPESFGHLDGAATYRPSRDLSVGHTRMAGKVGARAMQMMNNPEEIARTQGWMAKFGLSNQGMQFNQAKMMMQQPAQPPGA